jgi:TonB family protein
VSPLLPAWCRCWIVLLLMAASSSLSGQQAMQIDSRTVTKYVRPVVPDMARKMGLKGMVKLEAMVAPSGKVTSVKALGGHPLLVDSATLAVKSWVFAPGAQETRATINLNFQ